MTQLNQPIGIFGGTFDPIHFGHLRAALELTQTLPLAKIRFIPCQTPVHKASTQASVNDRLAMLHLAIDEENTFDCDEIELNRTSPSYMFDTLVSLHQQLPMTPLCLILGTDAFHQLPKWYRWQELIEYCHFIIMGRPNYRSEFNHNTALQHVFEQHKIDDNALLTQNTFGSILVHKVSQLEISSTLIRQLIQQGQSPRYLLPQSVLNYINEHQLYRHK